MTLFKSLLDASRRGFLFVYMCCDLAGSVGSREHIVRYSQKQECISFVSYCFKEFFNCCNFGTTGPIQVGFSAKCNSPKEDFNQIEN